MTKPSYRTGEWISIEIGQTRHLSEYKYNVKLNGKHLHSVVNFEIFLLSRCMQVTIGIQLAKYLTKIRHYNNVGCLKYPTSHHNHHQQFYCKKR